MLGLAPLQPVLQRPALIAIHPLFFDMGRERKALADLAARPPGSTLRQHERERLHRYWKIGWAGANLFALATMNGPEGATDFFSEGGTPEETASFTWAWTHHGSIPLGTRALWAVGKVGKPALKDYRQRLPLPRSTGQFLDALFSLLVIGLRHARLLGEVAKAVRSHGIERLRRIFPDEAEGRGAVELVERLLDDGEPVGAELLQRTRQILAEVAAAHGKGSAPTSELTDQTLLTAAIHTPGNYVLHCSPVLHMLGLLPLLARCELEDLYTPRALMSPAPWESLTLEMLQAVQRDQAPVLFPRTQQVAPKPGRNDPCPCGSGKKYKRCCGA